MTIDWKAKMIARLIGEVIGISIMGLGSYYLHIFPLAWITPWAIGMVVPTVIYTYKDNHE